MCKRTQIRCAAKQQRNRAGLSLEYRPCSDSEEADTTEMGRLEMDPEDDAEKNTCLCSSSIDVLRRDAARCAAAGLAKRPEEPRCPVTGKK